MTEGRIRCHLLLDDAGEPAASYQGTELDAEGRSAMLEIVGIARRIMDAWTPERARRHEAQRRRLLLRLARIRGPRPAPYARVKRQRGWRRRRG